jgi:uncharacterized membrane protein YeaQ/YmgE (transglycosylase-associated protein family)
VKKAIITGFIIFGMVVGFIAVWFRQHTDMVFLLNIPGTLIGDAVYGLSIRLFGDPHSPQAHYTIPWLFRIPQVYVPASVLFWGLLGTIFTICLKPKIIAWMMGLYLVVFGSFYLLAELGLV